MCTVSLQEGYGP